LVATAQYRPDRTALGVTLVVAAVFLMSIQDAVFKQFSTELRLWQIFTLRGVFAVPLVLIAAVVTGKLGEVWGGAIQTWSVIRTSTMVLMLIMMYVAYPFLSLSVVAAGLYTAPVFVTLLSAFAINEPVGIRGWFAIGLGFVGVLVILQLGTDAFSYWALLPVVSGFLYASSNVITRSKCQSVTPAALALSLQTGFLLAGILFSLVLLYRPQSTALINAAPFVFGAWSEVGTVEWLLVAGLAVLAIAISMALARAYQSARPSVVATFDYSYLVFVVAWDFLFFATPPTGTTLAGIALIVSAGMLALRR
jgi:drug/metabolite transporter (DMT)-like permease